jgi:hypothetical protein
VLVDEMDTFRNISGVQNPLNILRHRQDHHYSERRTPNDQSGDTVSAFL